MEWTPFLDHFDPRNGSEMRMFWLEGDNEASQSSFESVLPRAAERGTDNPS
jgi:hypothetical protein